MEAGLEKIDQQIPNNNLLKVSSVFIMIIKIDVLL